MYLRSVRKQALSEHSSGGFLLGSALNLAVLELLSNDSALRAASTGHPWSDGLLHPAPERFQTSTAETKAA